MAYHPANLALRLLIELGAVAGLFRLGLSAADGFAGLLLAIALSAAAVTLWATFNTPGDRSRSGRAPVRVAGPFRLIVEAVVLASGAAAWFVTGPRGVAWLFVGLTVFHYAVSWDRLAWLMRVDSDGHT